MKKLLVLGFMVISLQLNAGEFLKTLGDVKTILGIAAQLNPIAKEDKDGVTKACKCAGTFTAAACTLYCCGPKVCCCVTSAAICGYAINTNSPVISAQPTATTKKTK